MTLQRRGVVPVPSLPRRAVERPRKPVGAISCPSAAEPHPRPPAHQQGPGADRGGPASFTPAFTLPEAVYEGLREAAFRERCKIHDIVLEGDRDGAPEAGMAGLSAVGGLGAGAEPCLPEPMSEQVLEPELRKARS